MKKILLYLLIAMTGLPVAAQKSFWKEVSAGETSRLSRVIRHKNTDGEKYFSLNAEQIKQSLASVDKVSSNVAGVLVFIPNLNGQLEQFEVWENSNFDPALQARYPQIRSYTGKGITDKTATINFSLAPIGMQTAVFRTGKDAEFIEAYDSQATTYVLFTTKNSHSWISNFKCGTPEQGLTASLIGEANRSNVGQLKTMRLAMSCNGEYAQHFGGTVAGALAGMNASLTRINALFEKDLAIHLNLIANNDILVYLNAATDPYYHALRESFPAGLDHRLGGVDADIFEDERREVRGRATAADADVEHPRARERRAQSFQRRRFRRLESAELPVISDRERGSPGPLIRHATRILVKVVTGQVSQSGQRPEFFSFD